MAKKYKLKEFEIGDVKVDNDGFIYVTGFFSGVLYLGLFHKYLI